MVPIFHPSSFYESLRIVKDAFRNRIHPFGSNLLSQHLCRRRVGPVGTFETLATAESTRRASWTPAQGYDERVNKGCGTTGFPSAKRLWLFLKKPFVFFSLRLTSSRLISPPACPAASDETADTPGDWPRWPRPRTWVYGPATERLGAPFPKPNAIGSEPLVPTQPLRFCTVYVPGRGFAFPRPQLFGASQNRPSCSVSAQPGRRLTLSDPGRSTVRRVESRSGDCMCLANEFASRCTKAHG